MLASRVDYLSCECGVQGVGACNPHAPRLASEVKHLGWGCCRGIVRLQDTLLK
ncbi:hypothetical protein BJV78DRAFT_1187758 [Lactifluus subvellereus]|nr:hypothetical protein BJV78DRAFT_1187758 [Lactifluus subvellereus]